MTVAGRTALVNDADWRVLSQPEQRTSLKASFFLFFFSPLINRKHDSTVLSLASVNLKIISVKSY